MANPNLEIIKKNFNKVISYSQGIPDPKTDKLFEVWKEAKREFIEIWGGNLIYEFPQKIKFDLGEKEKHDRVIRFAGQVASQWGYTDLALFIEEQEMGFFDNLTVKDYTAWDGKVIKKGTKLVKSFKYFIKENERSLIDIQNEASRIIQESVIEGTLCLSVHPLDFLSLSENTYNWRSCHSLDGEYRAGNLSYMMDKNTIICYLKGNFDENLPNFDPEVRWNSKKWRVLLYVSDDWRMVIAGRQYPFESEVGMDIVLKELLPAARICVDANKARGTFWSDWNKVLFKDAELSNGMRVVFNSSYVVVDHELVSLEHLVPNGDGSKQFNDMLYSSCYSPIYAFECMKYCYDDAIPITIKATTTFSIGGYTYCLWCGQEECLTGADSMMCEKCELEHGQSDNDMFTHCDCCGNRVYTDDTYSVGDDWICPRCYDKYCRTCEECGEIVYEDYIHYYEPTQQYVCEYCLEELNEMNEKEYNC